MGIVDYVLGMGRSFYRGAGLVPEFSYVGAGSGLADRLRGSADEMPIYNLMSKGNGSLKKRDWLHGSRWNKRKGALYVKIGGNHSLILLEEMPESRRDMENYLRRKGASDQEVARVMKNYDQRKRKR